MVTQENRTASDARSPSMNDLNREVNRAMDQVKADVDELIDGLDLQNLTRRIEDFGRSNPFGLAVAALTLGVAAGLLVKRAPSGASDLRPRPLP